MEQGFQGTIEKTALSVNYKITVFRDAKFLGCINFSGNGESTSYGPTLRVASSHLESPAPPSPVSDNVHTDSSRMGLVVMVVQSYDGFLAAETRRSAAGKAGGQIAKAIWVTV